MMEIRFVLLHWLTCYNLMATWHKSFNYQLIDVSHHVHKCHYVMHICITDILVTGGFTLVKLLMALEYVTTL